MLSYQFLIDIFKTVLDQSTAIQGRFHVAPKGGTEINADNFHEVLEETVAGSGIQPGAAKYPLSFMVPPPSAGDYHKNDGQDEYFVTMFFLKQTYVTSDGGIQTINRTTNTSTHTVPQDWHDMKRCAVGFLRVLNALQRRHDWNKLFMIAAKQPIIKPVSFFGQDRTAGVRLDFNVKIFIGCDIEDYTTEGIAAIVLPATDSHPQHQL